MESTAKKQCNILVDVLIAHGIRHFVMSPGSRNAPIIVALARRDGIERHVVVDERSAAFIALGLAQQTGEPVAVVCTSGTALLNYAPAVAEAYYQKLPLIVISADRPMEWIDQDDSQTIRQYEALAQFVKKSYDLPPLRRRHGSMVCKPHCQRCCQRGDKLSARTGAHQRAD